MSPQPVKISLVTAVSRPRNLPRIHRSIAAGLPDPRLDVKWILVFDAPNDAPPAVQAVLDTPAGFRIRKLYWPHGPRKLGIEQKNMGIDACEDGFFHVLDDDNVVHPSFFARIGDVILENPDKKAFAFGQIRWDKHGDLMPSPATMRPLHIDNTMFVVHKRFVGPKRYDPARVTMEDGYFFMDLHRQDPSAWHFIGEYLSYYNYFSRFPLAPEAA